MHLITKENIHHFIAEGDTQKAVDKLFDHICQFYQTGKGEHVLSKFHSKTLLLSGRLNDLKKQKTHGIIDDREATLESNKINFACLDFINALPNYFWTAETIETANQQYLQTLNKTADSDFQYDVFLCYSSADSLAARKVWNKLTGLGFKVFFSEESLKNYAGKSFIDSIQKALLKSRHFILFSSPNAMDSEWVKAEYETFFNECALKAKRKFIILKGPNFDLQKVPILFRRFQILGDLHLILEVLKPEDVSKVAPEKKPAAPSSTFQFSKSVERNKEKTRASSSPIKAIKQEQNSLISKANSSRMILVVSLFWLVFLALSIHPFLDNVYSPGEEEFEYVYISYFKTISFICWGISLVGFIWAQVKWKSQMKTGRFIPVMGVVASFGMLFWTSLINGTLISVNEVAVAWWFAIVVLCMASISLIKQRFN